MLSQSLPDLIEPVTFNKIITIIIIVCTGFIKEIENKINWLQPNTFKGKDN